MYEAHEANIEKVLRRLLRCSDEIVERSTNFELKSFIKVNKYTILRAVRYVTFNSDEFNSIN